MAKTRDSSPIDQNNIADAFSALVRDHGATCIDLVMTRTSNGWISVHAQCFVSVNGDLNLYTTQSTYITSRGPDMLRVQWTHLTGLWNIVERARSGLPALIGI